MSIWNTIIAKLREMLGMISSKDIEKELNLNYAISPQMEDAIHMWSDMYKDKASWLHEPDENNPVRIASLGLATMIASEKARLALLEFESEISTPTEEVEVPNPDYPGEKTYATDMDGEKFPVPAIEPPKTKTEERPIGDTQRAEYLERQYKKLRRQLRKQIEYGIAKGGLVIKPYIVTNALPDDDTASYTVQSDIKPTTEIDFEFVQADSFYPLAFTPAGKITEAAFIQTKQDKAVTYHRLEYHKWDNNVVTVINKAYKSTSNSGDMSLSNLGKEISLQEVPEWKDFQPVTIIKDVTKPMFAYFRMPDANIIDTKSPLGVSGFARAVNLIKNADFIYSTLLWEYEGGALAIDIDRDALKVDDANGNDFTRLTMLQERLYRKIDLGSSSDTYQPFAPSLRDTNYINGLNTVLMRIEDTCGISRGTLSDAADVARTATELRILKQRSYQTNQDIQKAIEEALRDVIYIMNVYADLYNITPKGDYDISFEWDDSIMVDADEELEKRILLMQNGLASKVENRMWYFGETERQAREALAQIDSEQQQNQQMAMMNQYDLNNRVMNGQNPDNKVKTSDETKMKKENNSGSKN